MSDTPRKRDRWPWWRRTIVRVAWAIDVEDGSGTGAPSQSKILAYFLAACVCFMDALNWQQVAAMGLILAASYGRSMFKSVVGVVATIFSKKDAPVG
jgi:hypothetical protein